LVRAPVFQEFRQPTFAGSFRIVDKRVFLIGTLGVDPPMYLFVMGACLLAIAFTIAALAQLMKSPHDPTLWLLPLGGPAIAIFVFGMIRAGRWLSAGDERWLLAAIQSSLHKPTPTAGNRR
jgi:hypothetical protein